MTKKFNAPTPAFSAWWNPDGFNQLSGAQIGGHPDALRKCVRPDTHEYRYYGIKDSLAFNISHYYEEYLQWLRDGQPPRKTLTDGTAATRDQVKAWIQEIRPIIEKIGAMPF